MPVTFRTNRRSKKVHPILIPRTRSKLESEGREEAERFEGRLNKSFDGRIIDEVKDYSERYGIASPADVATEINSRGKDLVFQGELYYYAYKNLDKIKERMDELVEEGSLRKIRNPDGKDGYVLNDGRTSHSRTSSSRSTSRSRTSSETSSESRSRSRPKAIMDLEPSDL